MTGCRESLANQPESLIPANMGNFNRRTLRFLFIIGWLLSLSLAPALLHSQTGKSTGSEELSRNFLGFWKIDETAGDTAYINIKAKGRASVFWTGMASDKIETGTYVIEGNRLIVTWTSGYRDILEQSTANLLTRRTYAPGASLDGPSLSETRGERLDARIPGSLTVPPKGPRESPATITSSEVNTSVFRSPYLGYWEVRQGGGMLGLGGRDYFYLHLLRSGKANCVQRNWDDEWNKQTGDWSVQGNEVRIDWPSGHTDVIRLDMEGNRELVAYRPGQSVGGSNDGIFEARQVDVATAAALFTAGETRLFTIEDFVGYWRYDDRKAETRPHLEIERWGTASKFLDPNNPQSTRETGDWKLTQSGLAIQWLDSSTDLLDVSPTGYAQKTFAPNTSLAGVPTATQAVRRVSRNEVATAVAAAEARRRIEDETRKQKEAENRLRAQAEARRKAEEEAKRLAEEEMKQRELAEAQKKTAEEAEKIRLAEETARRAAEAEAARLALAEKAARDEAEAARRTQAAAAEESARLAAAEQAARTKAEENLAQEKADVPRTPPTRPTTSDAASASASAEVLRKQAAERQTQADEAKRLAQTEEEARLRREMEESTKRREELERQRREAEALAARRQAEAEAQAAERARLEEEVRRKADQEERRRAEVEAARKAEAEARARADEQARQRSAAEVAARPPQFTGLQPVAAKASSMNDLVWNLVWEEKFNSTSLDSELWNIGYPSRNIANNELSGYSEKAVRLKEGALLITARDQEMDYGNKIQPYTSGVITTFGKFEQSYGYFEARVRITEGNGLWPNFWLFSKGASAIRVLDIFGNEPDKTYHTVVSEDPASGTPKQTGFQRKGVDFSWEFHVVGVMWTPSAVIFHVDGEEVGRLTENIPDEPMSIVLSMAVGGDLVGAPDGWTPFPSYYWVDWVRVFKLVQ